MNNLKTILSVGIFVSAFVGGQVKASFVVEAFDISPISIPTVDTLIANNTTPDFSGTYSVIDFNETYGLTDSHYSINNSFPGGLTETFGLHVTGVVEIVTAGTYTFGTRHDDGVRLNVNGSTIIFDVLQGPARDEFGVIGLAAGFHSIDLVFYEVSGGAMLEFFAAAGSHTVFDENEFRLVGDTPNGGLPTSAVPLPAAVWLFGSALIGLLGVRRSKP